MNLKRLTLGEYQKRQGRSYLEECLENNTAEFYIIDYNGEEHEFFFYKNQDTADMCVEERSLNSLFDHEDAMLEIFSFLKDKGYKKAKIVLDNTKFKNRKKLALKYGFEEKLKIENGDYKFVEYWKNL